ncbi:MAG: class I SAM-dependent methyltransferase [Solirubrobacteraceae bacterium]|nr:class I SAM-dependent methyltransferase [Solirubrobacteraceae bacterium]
MRLLRKFVQADPTERRMLIRRRLDLLISALLIGRLAAWLHRASTFAYVSYLPDSVRLSDAPPPALARLQRLEGWWTHKNARRNAGDVGRLFFLALNAQRVIDEKVPGDFAEVGVYKGNSARVLAEVVRTAEGNRHLQLFDTFGGFDDREIDDKPEEFSQLFKDTSLDAVRDFVGEEACEYHSGWFPETTRELSPDRRFALVHLDADLYEPIRAGLEYFYDRMSSGGLVLVHDYSSGQWPGATQALDEFLEDKPERLVLMPDKAGTAIFRKA